MPDQFCPSCGTEVDADARFCPTCGQTLGEPTAGEEPMEPDVLAADADATSPIPSAPAWPPSELGAGAEDEPEPTAEPAETQGKPAAQPEPEPAPEPEAVPEPEAAPGPEAAAEPEGEDDIDAGPPPIPAWRQQAPQQPPAPSEPGTPPPATPPTGTAPGGGRDDLPITLPTMLSGWLIGGGSGFAALALLPRLASVLNVLIFVALLWVAATVFLADRMPRFEHQRLAILVTVVLALGVGLDRAAFTVRGVDTVFLVMALIAAAGALLVELDIDRPLPPPSGNG